MSKSNLSLVGTGELAESVNNALVKLKLGRHELMFQDGEWIAGKITYIFKLFVCLLNPSITKFLDPNPKADNNVQNPKNKSNWLEDRSVA